ncbi:hypothetical protein, conserved [Leishmania donovani]|uniref:Uncharacterized protein n=1 Tax=Leishmania donovani TaxID=5661 RepID=E9BR99_LEIDO|nr:hypothetical protein, conserved [Leishmania donovani]CBZ37778.1 hypothetical protein, conserved [Leishmania donovani]
MFYPLYPSPPAFSLMLTLTFSSLHDLPLMCVPVRLCLRASMFFFFIWACSSLSLLLPHFRPPERPRSMSWDGWQVEESQSKRRSLLWRNHRCTKRGVDLRVSVQHALRWPRSRGASVFCGRISGSGAGPRVCRPHTACSSSSVLCG